MPTKVIMPQLGESVTEGTITRWLVAKGERVEEFDPLLEINTDKVDTEIPSPVSGTVLEILIPEGTIVQTGTLLAWIGEQGETISEEDGGEGAVKAVAETVPRAASEGEATPIPPGRDTGLGFISPVVARIASEHQVNLTKVRGTGRGGRITKKDLLAYIEERVKEPERVEVARPVTTVREVPIPDWQQPADIEAPGVRPEPTERPTRVPEPEVPKILPGGVIPFTPVRRTIAEHMVTSKHTSPHVTTIMEADLSRVVAHRETNKEAFSRDAVNLTYTAYFVAASVSALKAHPFVNSSWSEEGIVIHREMNIGIAASLGEAGLIVPVIKNADGLSLLGLARAVNDLANRARARQLKPDEVKGGTFTITNHGVTGSLFATPIINQPQCAILGVGAIQKRVVVIGDTIAIRPMVYISLTFDHRILDGALADTFLGKVVESLQNWQ